MRPSQQAKHMNRILAAENAKWPAELVRVPPEDVPPGKPGATPPVEVWRSRDFLVQVYAVAGESRLERLSVNRTTVKAPGRWDDEITWDELQRLKRECGRGDCDALEVYPRDADVVNVANMRHLWCFRVGGPALPFAWRKPPPAVRRCSRTDCNAPSAPFADYCTAHATEGDP